MRKDDVGASFLCVKGTFLCVRGNVRVISAAAGVAEVDSDKKTKE